MEEAHLSLHKCVKMTETVGKAVGHSLGPALQSGIGDGAALATRFEPGWSQHGHGFSSPADVRV